MKKNTTDENTNIKVTVHIPDNVPDYIRQQKINRLYDLLKPKDDNDKKEKNSA